MKWTLSANRELPNGAIASCTICETPVGDYMLLFWEGIYDVIFNGKSIRMVSDERRAKEIAMEHLESLPRQIEEYLTPKRETGYYWIKVRYAHQITLEVDDIDWEIACYQETLDSWTLFGNFTGLPRDMILAIDERRIHGGN